MKEQSREVAIWNFLKIRRLHFWWTTSMRSSTGLFLLIALTIFSVTYLLLSSRFSACHNSQLISDSNQADLVQSLQRRIYQERVQHSISSCYSRKSGKVDQLYLHNESKLAYCPVAKIGCTFWKRIFLYLHNDTGKAAVDTPFQISRQFVHYGARERTKVLRWSEIGETKLSNYTKFVFSRDPYSRLWSAYLDKFLLPDFWRSSAGPVVKRRQNISERADRCRDDVTFEEFLKYVISLSPEHMNEHWQPVKYKCDPCLYKPDIVGKQETFTDDSSYILKGIGLDWVLSTFDDSAYVEEELRMLIDYNFGLFGDRFFKDCLDENSMAQLLWRVFQLNGYLPKDVDAQSVIQKLPKGFDKEAFKAFVLNFYHSSAMGDIKMWKLQKRQTLENAYRLIPEEVIRSIIELYNDDFEMFGYNTRPPGYEYKNV